VALLDIRQRAGSLFVVVLLGHVILISAQVQSKSGVPLIANVTFSVFAGVQRTVFSTISTIGNAWGSYIALRGVRQENEQLKHQLAEAQFEAQRQRALAGRTAGLERLLELRTHLDLRTTGARVIAAGTNLDFRAVTIDKGSDDGLQRDMAVIAPEGVVGRVVATSRTAAQVQLLTDVNAACGVIVERSGAQGIVTGAGDKGFRLGKVSEVADIQVGDDIVTSGIEGAFAIYPKGFAVGRIESISKQGSAYDEIAVKPAVDFSRLEEVLVVLTAPPAGGPPDEASR
jgi:rod shape-determining protein MreC